jgi:hypothetical protein
MDFIRSDLSALCLLFAYPLISIQEDGDARRSMDP